MFESGKKRKYIHQSKESIQNKNAFQSKVHLTLPIESQTLTI